MANLLSNLAGVGQDPEMAQRIFAALAASTQGRKQPTQLPSRQQAQLISPQELPSVDRHGLTRDAFLSPVVPFITLGAMPAGMGKSSLSLLRRFGRAKPGEDIGWILSDGTPVAKAGEHSKMLLSGDRNVGSVMEFVRNEGGVRVVPGGSSVGFEMGMRPTAGQLREMAKAAKGKSTIMAELPGREGAFRSFGDFMRFLESVP